METIVTAFRHELKYLISEQEKDILAARLKDILTIDQNAQGGYYVIRSLYFDDYWNTSYEEKLSGIAKRRKYRIRIYNYSDKVIRLECKHKQGNYIYKESAVLTKQEVECILHRDFGFLLKRQEHVCREFYIACMSEYMRPVVIVDYDRIPYVYEPGTVRITFDSHVRAVCMGYHIFDRELPAIEVMNPAEIIMEVKYTEYLPQIIRNILPPEHSQYIAASKYCMCYEKKQILTQ